MLTKSRKTFFLHILLFALLPITISKSIRDQSIPNTQIAQMIEEIKIEDFIDDNEKLNLIQKYQLRKDVKALRKVVKNSKIQVVHYEPPQDIKNKINECQYDSCKELFHELSEQPPTVEIPKDLQSTFIILHSDVPVNWKLGLEHRYIDGLFFNGFFPSSIIRSQFTTKITPLYSYSNTEKCPRADDECKFTKISNLRTYIDEDQYRNMIKLIFNKDADKFIILNPTQISDN